MRRLSTPGLVVLVVPDCEVALQSAMLASAPPGALRQARKGLGWFRRASVSLGFFSLLV